MGPRPLGRGILTLPGWPRDGGRGFNGATTSRSWNPTTGFSKLVPLTVLQWGHDLSVVESIFSSRTLDANLVASMGPRPLGRGIRWSRCGPNSSGRLQWGHDLSVVESLVRPFRVRAKEAASMGPRPLGRGIGDRRRRPHGAAGASMGPRPLGRGIPS